MKQNAEIFAGCAAHNTPCCCFACCLRAPHLPLPSCCRRPLTNLCTKSARFGGHALHFENRAAFGTLQASCWNCATCPRCRPTRHASTGSACTAASTRPTGLPACLRARNGRPRAAPAAQQLQQQPHQLAAGLQQLKIARAQERGSQLPQRRSMALGRRSSRRRLDSVVGRLPAAVLQEAASRAANLRAARRLGQHQQNRRERSSSKPRAVAVAGSRANEAASLVSSRSSSQRLGSQVLARSSARSDARCAANTRIECQIEWSAGQTT